MVGTSGGWKQWFRVRMSTCHHCLCSSRHKDKFQTLQSRASGSTKSQKIKEQSHMPEQEQDTLWGWLRPSDIEHTPTGKLPQIMLRTAGMWPILSILAHTAKRGHCISCLAWKCSFFLPGPKKKVHNAARKNCRDSDVLQ